MRQRRRATFSSTHGNPVVASSSRAAASSHPVPWDAAEILRSEWSRHGGLPWIAANQPGRQQLPGERGTPVRSTLERVEPGGTRTDTRLRFDVDANDLESGVVATLAAPPGAERSVVSVSSRPALGEPGDYSGRVFRRRVVASRRAGDLAGVARVPRWARTCRCSGGRGELGAVGDGSGVGAPGRFTAARVVLRPVWARLMASLKSLPRSPGAGRG